jgi:hypothetical protein
VVVLCLHAILDGTKRSITIQRWTIVRWKWEVQRMKTRNQGGGIIEAGADGELGGVEKNIA